MHLKATMMKVSDPIIFGACVEVFYKPVFEKYAEQFEKLGVDLTNGLGDVYAKVAGTPIQAEVEDAINQHPKVNESAVVGYPHAIKGSGIYAYVICDEDGILGEVIEVLFVFNDPSVEHIVTIDFKDDSGSTVNVPNYSDLMENIPSKIKSFLGIICSVAMLSKPTPPKVWCTQRQPVLMCRLIPRRGRAQSQAHAAIRRPPQGRSRASPGRISIQAKVGIDKRPMPKLTTNDRFLGGLPTLRPFFAEIPDA